MTDLSFLLGRQTFDGLGRQRSVQVAGRITHHHYRPGQLPPAANTLADGTRLAYTYEPQLDNALLSSTPEGQPADHLSYHATLGLPIAASNTLGVQQWHFTPSGKALRDTWTVDDIEHSTHWQHSLNGLVLGFTDGAGVEHQRQHDAFGRLSTLSVGEVRTTFAYDALSRLATVTTHDPAGGRQLSRQLSYDSMGREAQSTFVVVENGRLRTWRQQLGYSALDQVVSRTWDDGEQHAEEHFAYDVRGRLVQYTANGSAAPLDPFGNAIVEQRFAFNALDGLHEVVSTFADGSQDRARFNHAEDDPTQTVSITHTHASWPARIDLYYDACGRVTGDNLGRSMTWTADNRLASVTLAGHTCHYRYNAGGQLCDRVLDGSLERSFHSAGQLTHVLQGEQHLTLAGDGSTLFALNQVTQGVRRTILLGCDAQGSVRLEACEQVFERRYTAHGTGPGDSRQPFGYAGERREPLTGWYIPAGYRPYDPVLMCFLAPDDESPFGRGGINPYAYCGGDPINRVDPDGHSWVNWAVGGVGLALTAAATLASLGTVGTAFALLFAGGLSALSPNAALAIGAATLGIASLGTGVASMALEISGKHQQAASILGWVSLGSGVTSAMTATLPRAVGLAGNLRNLSGQAGRRPAAFKPYRLGPGGKARPASVLFGRHKGMEDVAFIPHLHGTGAPALMTHGTPLGHTLNAQGQLDKAANVARQVIAPRLDAMGYPAGEKIVLLSCWGGRSGAAQTIANTLQRPVEAASGRLYLTGVAGLQSPPKVAATSTGTNVPLAKVSLWRSMTSNPVFRDDRRFRIADFATYYPE